MISRSISLLIFSVFLCLALCACSEKQGGEKQGGEKLAVDTLIINGLVYDGSMNEPREVAIGIKQDRIAFVGNHPLQNIKATSTIDARGKMVTPGFIDVHTHSLAELKNPATSQNLNYITQGVTTVFNGNDGGGTYAIGPLSQSLETAGIGTNVAFLVGHGTVREAVMGRDNRAPTAAELEEMKTLVAQAMEAGALGLSSGLYYVPGNYASTAEVVELAAVAARYNGIYDSHIRDESSYSLGLLAALEEAIEIGRQAELPVHIAHIKALGVDVWGQSQAAIALIEAARSEGLQVTADQYPWAASGTHLGNALVPRWVMADSTEKYQQRLRSAELLPKIRREMAENLRRRGGAESLLIVDGPRADYAGRTLADIANEEGVAPIESALGILRLGKARVVSFNMNLEDIRSFMTRDWVMTSSDGNDGHPRKYASFPRKYRSFVVEDKLLTTEAFVHRSSGLAADTFGLDGRGYLRPGNFADIAIIDADNFRPVADYLHWNKLSEGVEYLFVNGIPTIEQGVATGALAGRVVRRN